MCRVEYPTRRHWHRLPALDIQIDGLLPTYVRRLFFVLCRLYSEGTGSMVYYHYDM